MTFIQIISIVTLIGGIFVAVSVGDEELTADQKNALEEFKSLVLDKLPENYTKEDLHLSRFLRAKNFDLDKAEKLILRDSKWRIENKMDEIHLEDFEDFESQGFKIYLEGFDRQGKPMITSNVGRWDFRKVTSLKTLSRMKRYIDKNFELATRKVAELRKSGKNVTQWDFIIDGNSTGNESQEKRCMACANLYVHLINTYEQHYPNYADKLFIFNAPKSFDVGLKKIRSMLSASTNKTMMVFGLDREIWEPELLKIADPSQLPPEYGGTKIYSS